MRRKRESSEGESMNVETFLKSHGQSVFTLSPDESVADAALRFSELTGQRKYSLAIVCEGDKLCGTVTRD